MQPFARVACGPAQTSLPYLWPAAITFCVIAHKLPSFNLKRSCVAFARGRLSPHFLMELRNKAVILPSDRPIEKHPAVSFPPPPHTLRSFGGLHPPHPHLTRFAPSSRIQKWHPNTDLTQSPVLRLKLDLEHCSTSDTSFSPPSRPTDPHPTPLPLTPPLRFTSRGSTRSPGSVRSNSLRCTANNAALVIINTWPKKTRHRLSKRYPRRRPPRGRRPPPPATRPTRRLPRRTRTRATSCARATATSRSGCSTRFAAGPAPCPNP